MNRTLARGLVAVIAVIATTQALACGQNFGLRLLHDRDRSLQTLWDGDFRIEAGRLVPAPAGLAWPDIRDAAGEPVAAMQQRAYLQARWLEPALQELAEAASAADDADAAWVAGEGLPEAARAYLAGAVAWRSHQARPDAVTATPSQVEDADRESAATTTAGTGADGDRLLATAMHWFGRAAETGAAEHTPWPLLGQYMLGRSHGRRATLSGDVAEAEVEAGLAAFARVRERVLAGAADPLGLGAASLSESARLLADLGRVNEAARLYAEHAALGSAGAAGSLLELVSTGVREESTLRQLLAGSPGRQVVLLYAYTHAPSADSGDHGELDQWPADHDADLAHAGPADLAWGVDLAPYRYLNGEGQVRVRFAGALEALLASVAARPDLAGPDAARMAALAWRQGRFELAQRWHAVADGPLASWVGAKLALRQGRLDDAARHFGDAAAAFVPEESWGKRPETLVAEPHCQVQAEHGVLALARGEVRASLELLLSAGAVYWLDAAYVAERVLATDELIELVDGWADNPALQAIGPHSGYQPPPWYEEDSDWRDPVRVVHEADVGARLRHLLARRLMREGRFDEALPRLAGDKAGAEAARYAGALRDAQALAGQARARALFTAATTARRSGLDFLGYETGPDWRSHQGNHAQEGTGEWLLQAGLPAEQRRWIHDVEHTAIQAQQDRLQPRFHYRLVAAELADQAADSLDPASPQFAAVLCHASSWLLDREPELGRVYYRRYLRQAPPAPWHEEFGRRCPAPEFSG